MGGVSRNKTRMVIIIFLFTTIVYFLTSAGNTAYNHFTLLADAFLKGHLYIEGIMPWLEKVPLDATKFYVVNPPIPAVISLPFVFLFGKNFPQQYIAHLVGAAITAILFLITIKITKNIKKAIYIALLVGFGNIIWFLSSVGSIWYLGQITGILFLTIAVYEYYGKNRPILIGVLLFFACMSRIQLLLSIPFFILPVIKNKKYILKMLLGISPFFIFYPLYNYLRFGNIFQAGYTLIPGITTEPWFSKGPFHYSYIPNHLKAIFTSLPQISTDFPFVKPTLSGLPIWLTTPAFIYAFKNKIRDIKTLAIWVGIIGIAIVNFSYGSIGIAQFGYRYAVDFYPLLFLLIIHSIKDSNLRWHHWLLLSVSIVVNTWGVLWINKFGWVSF